MTDHEFEQEQEIYATLVEIKQEPTELYKILKFESLVSGGGEAKQVIAEGYVFLNGQVETQKRKKVYAGDLISFNDQHFQIALKGETADYEFVAQEEGIETSYPASQTVPEKVQKKSKQPKVKKARKPISF
ncbi:RNA-binding S4 domain-containing protein [Psychromonas ossibalaenae]|uniref:RNA-binding S4 domain-containing protein n=1 Tax=Psychromonas ossibalaenae TaxID=444922 RepID=UPI00037C148D|nr:RNA-binding S4 domain-containing protein [Psychromonas ossibalaenae]